MSVPLKGIIVAYVNVNGEEVAVVGGGYYGTDANTYFVHGVDKQTFPVNSSGQFDVVPRPGATNGALNCTRAVVP